MNFPLIQIVNKSLTHVNEIICQRIELDLGNKKSPCVGTGSYGLSGYCAPHLSLDLTGSGRVIIRFTIPQNTRVDRENEGKSQNPSARPDIRIHIQADRKFGVNWQKPPKVDTYRAVNFCSSNRSLH